MNKTIFLSVLSLFLPLVASAHVISDKGTVSKDKNIDIYIAQKSNELFIELSAPGANLVGYENRPVTTAQKIEFNRVMSILKNPRTFFAVNAEAGCKLSTKNVGHSLDRHQHSKGLKHRANEFFARYVYKCNSPSQIKDIKYHWFKTFPTTEKILIKALTPKGSKNGHVTASSRRFYFK